MPSTPRMWILNPFHNTRRCPPSCPVPYPMEDAAFSPSGCSDLAGTKPVFYFGYNLLYPFSPIYKIYQYFQPFNHFANREHNCPLHIPSPTLSLTLMNNSLTKGSKRAAWDHPQHSPTWVESQTGGWLGLSWAVTYRTKHQVWIFPGHVQIPHLSPHAPKKDS